MNRKKKVTPSLEDYLETIYFLYEKDGPVRVTDVAISMEISKPSVNKAINSLKDMKYVSQEPYGLLYLTESGKKMAEGIAKKHFLIKRFLTDLLGIDKETAEEEACLIEHHMSDDTIDKLEKFMDRMS